MCKCGIATCNALSLLVYSCKTTDSLRLPIVVIICVLICNIVLFIYLIVIMPNVQLLWATRNYTNKLCDHAYYHHTCADSIVTFWSFTDWSRRRISTHFFARSYEIVGSPFLYFSFILSWGYDGCYWSWFRFRIQKSYVQLLRHLQSSKILPELFQEKILHLDDMDEINAPPTPPPPKKKRERKEQWEKLVKMILQSGRESAASVCDISTKLSSPSGSATARAGIWWKCIK